MGMGMRPQVDFSLYLITDRRQVKGRDVCTSIEGALRGGVRTVQLREKDLSGRELFDLAGRLREITSRYGAKLLINDRLDVALAVEADGIHLGGNSLPVTTVREITGKRLLIGVSCHGRNSALAAQEGGADFITFGPIYHTPSKASYGEPLGPWRLAEVTRLLRIPVFAIGGITRDMVPEVLSRGAHGIALISAILAADNPEKAARELLAFLPGSR